LDVSFISCDGELIHNTGSLVELPANAFRKTSHQVVIRTVAALKAALAGDTDPDFMASPFVTGGADTEAELVQKIIPISFHYVCHLL
jgi:hypothetical protein